MARGVELVGFDQQRQQKVDIRRTEYASRLISDQSQPSMPTFGKICRLRISVTVVLFEFSSVLFYIS